MSVSFLSFFVNTPIPWAAILCIILYRHDLSQIMHPVKERNSMRDWILVFRDLGITAKQSSTNDDHSGRKRGRIVSLIRRFSEDVTERYPNTRFYCFIIAIVVCSSLIASLVFGWVFLDSRFGALILAVAQFSCALPLVFAMQRYFGSSPSAPFKYHLKSRRTGSLLRYGDVLSPSRVS
jgi:hypothetical protein